jgi:UDP-N-acetylmuramoylalanine--D-glutamate ligase
MEEVARRDVALFINDSKATNADSAEKALASFDRIHWILGGQAKEGGIERLRPYFGKSKGVSDRRSERMPLRRRSRAR